MPSFLLVLFFVLLQTCPCRTLIIVGQGHLRTRGRRYRDDPAYSMGLSMSLDRQQQKRQVESKQSSCRQFFEAFNDRVNERVDKADRVQCVSSDMSDTLLVNMTSITVAQQGATFFSEDTINFVKRFTANGGSALVRLSEKDAEVMSNMWGLASTVFDEIDRLEGEDRKNTGLRYQNLIRRNDKLATSKKAGYNYVETNNRDESLRALEDIVGNSSASKVALDSWNTLTEIGTQLAAMITTVLLSMEHRKAHTLMEHLIGRPDEEKSISFQRLARYMEASQEEERTMNLGSHCDWSIFTIVPVSDVSGLQVYDISSQTWICPEAVARIHAGNNLSERWNGSYAVVMAGKYLELLTNGKVESTIHRVVSPRNTARRYSAPFFLRLNLEVLDALENVPLEQPNNVLVSSLAMSKFLQGLSLSS